MTELDFDELDKAVNSLMSGVDTSKRNTALDDPEVKVVALNPSDEPVAETNPAPESTTVPAAEVVEPEPIPEPVATAEELAPATEAPDAPTSTQQAPATASKPSLAVKRRGQFMDMIHPSSDMKSAQPKVVRREGVVLAPLGAPAPTAKEVSLPEAEAIQSEPTEAQDQTAPEPLSSPFLPDAKPEKRPLGGAIAQEQPAIVENTDDTEIATQITPEPSSQVLPEELSSDVLAVESNDLSKPTQAPEEVPVKESIEEDSPAEVTEPEAARVPAGGSIAQQYTESPSTGEQTSGSIYDTANYHQPIESAKPVKKTSPLKWIILAVALLAVGGGAGVGYFLLTH